MRHNLIIPILLSTFLWSAHSTYAVENGCLRPVAAGEKHKAPSTDGLIIKPEEVILYYKCAGESVERESRNSIWSKLPPELRDFTVLTPIHDDTEGMVVLTNNTVLRNSIRGNNNGLPEVYEVSVKGKVSAGHIDSMRKGVTIKVGRMRHGQGYAVHVVRLPDLELLESDERNTCIRVRFDQHSERIIGAVFDKFDYAVTAITRVEAGGVSLSGIGRGIYRRLSWNEVPAIIKTYLGEARSMPLGAPEQYRSIPDEIEDAAVIEFLLSDKGVTQDALHNIFRRFDINPDDILSEDLYYYKEGGFKRVYRVTIRTRDTKERFSFFVKVVKPDVKKTDSGYSYDERYASRITGMVQKARQHDLSLYPSVAGFYTVHDRDGRKRILFVEGIVPPTNAVLTPAQKDPLAIATYLMYYHILGVFFDDPKPANIVIHSGFQRGFKGTMIDNDNAYLDRTHPHDIVYALVLHGYKAKDIVDSVVAVLGNKQAEKFLLSASFPPEARYTIKDVVDEFLTRRETISSVFMPPAEIKMPIGISVNGARMKVPTDTTLLDILEDCYVDLHAVDVALDTQAGRRAWFSSTPFKERKIDYHKAVLSEGARVFFVPRGKAAALIGEKPPTTSKVLQQRSVRRGIRTPLLETRIKSLTKQALAFTQLFSAPSLARDADMGEVRSFQHLFGRLIGGMHAYLRHQRDDPFTELDRELIMRRFTRIDFAGDAERAQAQEKLITLLDGISGLSVEFMVPEHKPGSPKYIEKITLAQI